jgi:dipeptidyl aminopeptidase/acylaminoacyl peptidase
LYAAAKPLAILDTNIVPDEIVNVEVWNSLKGKLYTQQNVDAEKDKKKSFTFAYDIDNSNSYQLTNESVSNFNNVDSLDLSKVYLFDNKDYLVQSVWEGRTKFDVYINNALTNNNLVGIKGLLNLPSLSPNKQYLLWFNPIDTTWNSYHIADNQFVKITNNKVATFYDHENDQPDYPNVYGVATWLDKDENVLIYDELDLWMVDPSGKMSPYRLTNGKETHTEYRYIHLDKTNNYLVGRDSILLHTTDKNTYEEGYVWYSISKNRFYPIVKENLSYSNRIYFDKKLKTALFTKESFLQYPDLELVNNLNFNKPEKISDVNPQQKNYNWGTIELVKWIDPDGKLTKGLLVKPADFDPNKKYPMIVNFYEKESDNILRHRAPEPNRSSINYAFYASRGYVIFNPDITYKIGYPGKSALDIVESGVKYILSKGFVDPNRVGIQGHSWGGYQIAYILTKSKMFRCAESGAPVVNMTSAYGGIRWETGLSRMFQYEKAQSRLGATLWENPKLYLENSPLFEMDKVTTPVLVMSNDKDGHVPWYQGIEYFVALRRLGKPAWLLNYNGEPHWPVKLQNRIDFNIRMQQYFDYYLKDYNMPTWMSEEMKSYEKGINLGY